ncbi:MAG: TonB-dependent receptor [Alphaproteobacteria bacterium]|nr:TonB-dependent receptor [Alphaproteobacteria bacterium]
MKLIWKIALLVSASACANLAANAQSGPAAEPAAAADDAAATDTIVVIGEGVTHSTSETTETMALQKAPVSSVLDQIGELPGVLVSEGDTFGGDDWSTTISLRGFQSNLSEQQIGITVDGLPNGNSGYGGGAKANRYIDSPNLDKVEVSQGTADVASRSLEALGGTLNFTTSDPLKEKRLRFIGSAGSFNAQKEYARYDTGEFLPNTYAWLSISHQEQDDWVDSDVPSTRDHAALKVKSDQGPLGLTGYLSWDDTHEHNYQSITPAEFAQDPNWDRLTSQWLDNPYVNQLYRPAWGTLRQNLFGYIKGDYTPVDGLKISGSVYDHELDGRGDWVPPYLVDVTDDGAGNPESELNSRVDGGPLLGQIFFVDANGAALSPTPGCASSITFPYGGAGPQYDPACYPANAIPVQSYRHTHYQQKRRGVTADFAWDADFGAVANTLRGGVWYEDTERDEYRDWHTLIDARVGDEFNSQPYWVQYNRKYPYQTLMYYIEDQATFGPVTARFGLKQYDITLKREDLFGASPNIKLNSDSDLLPSGGLTWKTPVSGLELFAGYGKNFSSIKDGVLEAGATALGTIKPETAENVDYGARYVGRRFSGSITGYNIRFSNRVTFVPATTGSGAPDYLNEAEGSYINVGGIESKGVEAAGTFEISDNWSLYGAYTHNDSKYLGTGSAAGDALLGIYVGNTVRGALKQTFVASADWRDNNYFAGLSYKWVDKIYVDAANTTALDSFGVADLYVGVNVDAFMPEMKGLDLRLNVNNLFDESYMSGVVGDGTAYIGAPRSVVLTLTADF